MSEGTNIMATNGWDEYKRMFLDDREQRRIWEKGTDKKLNNVVIEIAKLKMKSGIWGAIAGMIPVVLFLIYMSLK